MGILYEKMKQLNIELTEKQTEQFQKYYEMLVEWNKVMNLTSITEYDEVVEKHFCDSAALVKAIPLDKELRLIDIGTGAGFPGIPLKILFPNLHVTLLDSLNKRIRFLNEVIEQLELDNIEALHGRAEDYAKKAEYREQYDVCVSRAVANLASLSEYCLPYVKINGYFIPYKSGKIEEELMQSQKAIEILGGKTEEEIKFNLLNTDISRSLIKIKKVKKTGNKYPRKAGMPAKEPIH